MTITPISNINYASTNKIQKVNNQPSFQGTLTVLNEIGKSPAIIKTSRHTDERLCKIFNGSIFNEFLKRDIYIDQDQIIPSFMTKIEEISGRKLAPESITLKLTRKAQKITLTGNDPQAFKITLDMNS